jgi:ABC-type transporter Mla maintaining outer membrane lipid asymmetry ATPase subunit MlaF
VAHEAQLDPLTAAQIDSMLARLRSVFGTTVIALTHDIDTARAISDRISCSAVTPSWQKGASQNSSGTPTPT